MSRLALFAALLGLACGGESAQFSDLLEPSGPHAGAPNAIPSGGGAQAAGGTLAGEGGSGAMASAPASGGDDGAHEDPVTTNGGMPASTGGAGGTMMSSGGTGTGGDAGGPMSGSGQGGAGGAPQPQEELLVELVAPNETYQSQYNYALDPTATFSFSLAGFSASDKTNPAQICRVLQNEPVANHYTGKNGTAMPDIATACTGADTTRITFHFRLDATKDGGGSFRVRSGESIVSLASADVTRWEYEITQNEWVTISAMPNVYRWDSGVKVRVYGYSN